MRAASVPGIHRHTYEAYLEYESSSNVKHEFIDGDIYAMAGGTIGRTEVCCDSIAETGDTHQEAPRCRCVVTFPGGHVGLAGRI